MERFRFAMVRMYSVATQSPGIRSGGIDASQIQKAVEKAGPWKSRKTTNRFPASPTAPWKSRRGSAIPTFPPLRRLLLFYPTKRHASPLRQAEGGQQGKSIKPDRSRVNESGQID